MDVTTPLITITTLSVGVPWTYLHATTHSTDFLIGLKFYAIVSVAWTFQLWSWILYRVILRPRYISRLRYLPEPTENRSWWNGYGYREYTGMKGAMVIEWQKHLKHNGILRYLGILNRERLVVTTPEAVDELMRRGKYAFPKTKRLEKLAAPLIGYGLVIVNGDEHTRQRRLLTPVFAMKHMRALEPIFWEKSLAILHKFDQIIERTKAASGFSEPINIDVYTGLVALDTISKAALGKDYGSIQNPDSELVANYREVFEPTLLFRHLAMARYVFPLGWLKKLPIRRVQNAVRAIDLLHASFHDEIDKKKALMSKGELKTNDIISCLIRDRHCEDDNELVTHMLTMLGAGHETVAVTLTWAIYEFCRVPEWQISIRDEIRSRLPSPESGNIPDYADLEHENMPLLNAFVSEILRYWPAIPLASRTAASDSNFQGIFVPASTKISISIIAFNRDPANWGPEAARFNPSRWLAKDEKTGELKFDSTGGALHKTAFQTFLHGQRACIGRVFARHEILNVLSCWIGRMDFVLTDIRQMDETMVEVSGGGITSVPLNGIYVHARRVEGWETAES